MGLRQNILVVDDEPNMAWLFEQGLSKRYKVVSASTGEEGLRLAGDHTDLVLLDLRLPDMDGLEVMQRLREKCPGLPVIMMTAYASIKNAVEAMKAGAYDYVVKPFEVSEVEQLIEHALTVQQFQARAPGKQVAEGQAASEVIAVSPLMQEVLNLVHKVADTDANILLQGESGTGKEVIAGLLHNLSDRAQGPLLPVNCAALPDNLLESELFGYEAGAFTGASRAKPGKFEQAAGGTLFLDEVGDLPLGLQAKLLRVLEEKIVERLGGSKRIKVDVRLIAATNKDLVEMVGRGVFREDLFYRLAVIPIYIPALRERQEDIIPLANHFMNVLARKYGREKPRLNQEVLEALLSHTWPGNVRELRNLMERLVILCSGREVTLADLPRHLRSGFRPVLHAAENSGVRSAVNAEKEKLERELIVEALARCNNNRTKAAEYLGVSRRWLQMKIKTYGLI